MNHQRLSEALNDFLDGSSWVGCFTSAQLERIRYQVTVREYPSGSVVCLRGTPSNQWLGVVDGMLKVETVAAEGKAATFAGVPAGAWMGEGTVLKGELRPYDVVAIRDSVVASIPRPTFLSMLTESHPFSLWMIQQLNTRLGYYVALVQSFRLNDTTKQVAYCLAELFNPSLYPNGRRQISISQEEIGRLSGVSRTIANRSLGELQDRGVIKIGYGTLEVTDLNALNQMAHGA